MYFRSTLASGRFPQKAQKRLEQNSMFSSYLVLLIYVKEMIYLPENLPFFKIHVNHFFAWDDSPAAHVISMHVMGEGPGAILWDTAFLSLAGC